MAYYFHWDYETLMNMEHRERTKWCEEISRINQHLSTDRQRSLREVE